MQDYEWKTTTKNIRTFASEVREQADILSEEEEEENEFYNETYTFNKLCLPEGDDFNHAP
jgi:hypothetical protein